MTETCVLVIKAGLKGAVRGGAAGAVASIVSGASVTFTAPAWAPLMGGALLISGGTLAIWTAVGSGTGTVTGGAWAYLRKKNQDRKFHETFGQ